MAGSYPKISVVTWCVVTMVMAAMATDTNLENVKGEARVLVLGAGVAGVAAARALTEAGVEDFLVLEGSGRVGGRCRAVTIGGFTVETGPQSIHGSEAAGKNLRNNPIYDLALKYNLTLTPSDVNDWVVRDLEGLDMTEEANDAYEKFYEAYSRAYSFSHRLQTEDLHSRPDTNFRAALRSYGWRPRTPLEDAIDYFDTDMETGHSPEGASARYYYDHVFDDYKNDVSFVRGKGAGGFSRVLQTLLVRETLGRSHDNRLRLNQVVTKINQSDDSVVVTTSDGDQYVGEQVIITFSLGVLQQGGVHFSPPLPQWKQDAINQFVMSDAKRVILKYPDHMTPFWDDSEWMLYTTERRGYFSVWLNLNKVIPGSNMLQCTLLGDHASYANRLPDADVAKEALRVLRAVYGAGVPDPQEVALSHWGTDPLFYGAYSTWPPAYPACMKASLRAPVARVHFAGEAMHQRSHGYLQSAYLSGEEAGQVVARCINEGCTVSTDNVTCGAAGRRIRDWLLLTLVVSYALSTSSSV